MASRTKDNDFSRIKLTDDEIQSKKKIQNELQRKHLSDKVERMKARIELEEKEKLLPRKRKRKSKGEGGEFVDDPHFNEDRLRDEERDRDSKHNSNSKHKDKNSIHKKASRPPPPAMSFSELLKVAEAKQHEPIVIPKKQKEDEKLLTKKQRKIEEQEQDRIRRKMERDRDRIESSNGGPRHSSSSKPSLPNGKSAVRPPPVAQKNGTPCSAQSFKIPKGGSSVSKSVPVPKTVEKSHKVQSNNRHSNEPSAASRTHTNHDRNKPSATSHTNHDRNKPSKSSEPSEKPRPKENKSVLNNKKPIMVAKPFRPNGEVEADPVLKPFRPNGKVQTAPVPAAAPVPTMTIDTDAIAAAIEKRIREKIEKEIEEKFAAKFAANSQSASRQENRMKPSGSMNGKSQNQPSKRPLEMSSKERSRPPIPAKKPFHPNPYLDPPRKRLEPIRPQSK